MFGVGSAIAQSMAARKASEAQSMAYKRKVIAAIMDRDAREIKRRGFTVSEVIIDDLDPVPLTFYDGKTRIPRIPRRPFANAPST